VLQRHETPAARGLERLPVNEPTTPPLAAQASPVIRRSNREGLLCHIGICSRLLDRIAASGYEVLAQRVRVPASEKVWILARSLV